MPHRSATTRARPASVLTALAVAALSGCRLGRAEAATLEAHLPAALARGPGTVVDLASVVDRPWREVAVFGPYTGAAAVARCVSASEGYLLSRGIEGRDDVTLLVFSYADGSHASVALPRRTADFGPESVGAVYARPLARFRVRRPGPGTWGDVVPARGVTRRCA